MMKTLSNNVLPLEKRTRILIVDDDPIICQLAHSKLESDGHEVVSHLCGQGGWEEVKNGGFDLAIFDLVLPDVHGFKLIEQVRSHPLINQLPIIVVTSRKDTHDIEKAYDLGATSFVIKPVNWSQFGHQVKYVLRSAERKKALQQAKMKAEKANEHKDNIIKVLSHELRTPLHQIIGFSEVLQSQLVSNTSDDSSLEYVDNIVEAGRRLLTSLSDVMLFSQILSNDVELMEDEYKVSRLLNTAMSSIGIEAEKRSVTVTSPALQNECQIICDFHMLSRVLINILDNALKFSNDGGSIQIGMELLNNGSFIYTIKDFGQGMDQEALEVCQSPFRQADKTLTRNSEGIGMGLPISKAIVEMHGGSLQISSNLDSGTEVTIMIPPERVIAAAKQNLQ